jgi:hypothetical protein
MSVLYQLATEENKYEYVKVVTQTNCTDKLHGHYFEWIFGSHPDHGTIARQHPKLLKAGCVVRCVKCKKVTSST